jgi:hypothetical protein
MNNTNDIKNRIDKLPEEIIESQKSRASLLRWKLFICALIGAAGVGVTGNNRDGILILLCFIPIVCVYVDLLCTNINLRIILIGKFYAGKNDTYEKFVCSNRIVFSLEDWALYGSTYAVSIILIIFSFFRIAYLFCSQHYIDGAFYCFIESAVVIIMSIFSVIFLNWIVSSYKILLKHEPLEYSEDAEMLFINELSGDSFIFPIFHKFVNKIKKIR